MWFLQNTGFVCITDKAQSREDRLRIEGRKIVKTSNPGTRHHQPELYLLPMIKDAID